MHHTAFIERAPNFCFRKNLQVKEKAITLQDKYHPQQMWWKKKNLLRTKVTKTRTTFKKRDKMVCIGLLVCSLIEHCLLEMRWYSSWIITQAAIMQNKCMIKFLLASVGLSLYFMQKNPINVYIFHGMITEPFHQDPFIHFIKDAINHSQ